VSKPKPITLDQIVAASTIHWCGEQHLVVLLQDGRIHLPSHERRERAAEKLAARARIPPENACIAILRKVRSGEGYGLPNGFADAYSAAARYNRHNRPGRALVVPAPRARGEVALRGHYTSLARQRLREALNLTTVYKKGDEHDIKERDTQTDVEGYGPGRTQIHCDVLIRRKNKKRIRETTIQVRVPLLTWLRTVWPVTDRGTVAGHLALALLDTRRNGDLVLLLGKPSHGYKIVARGAVVRGGLIKEWI
jgi:hypothetical protein